MNDLISRTAVIILLLVGASESVLARTATPATGIRVLVYGIHYGGNLVYNYMVINNSDTPFSNFTIGSGFDSVENDDYPQLVRLPLGWKEGEMAR